MSCAACDAGALPFAGESFDAVITNYGMPHFPDPAVAIAECVRVLKPGGRFAFSVWETPDKAVGFGAIYAAVHAHGRIDVGLPPGPNFFLFSDPEQSRLAMKRAGLEDVLVIRAPQVWRAASPDVVLETIRNGTVRAAALLRAQTTQAMQAIRQHVWDALAPFQTDGGYEIPMPAVVAAGVKRGASRS